MDKKILIILIGLSIFSIVFLSGCINPFDPCEVERQECNNTCGDGLLGGLCKDACTIQYNTCRNDR